jgi:hypothetical protein
VVLPRSLRRPDALAEAGSTDQEFADTGGRMTSLDYLAGILEVSGSLTITARKNRLGPRAMLQIQSENKALPGLFAERFGGAVNWSQVSSGKRWAWAKTGKAAQAVLRELRPFIQVRADDFDRILALELRNRGGVRRMPIPTVGVEPRRLAA